MLSVCNAASQCDVVLVHCAILLLGRLSFMTLWNSKDQQQNRGGMPAIVVIDALNPIIGHQGHCPRMADFAETHASDAMQT